MESDEIGRDAVRGVTPRALQPKVQFSHIEAAGSHRLV